MPRSKRVQVLMEPDEFSRLEQLATHQGIAVAALIRQAITERYFGADGQRQAAALRINGLGLGSPPDGSGPDLDADALASRLTLGRTEGLR